MMTRSTEGPRSEDIVWHWCRDPTRAKDIARFFVSQAQASYISHAELQGGRASAPGRWSNDLQATIEAEAGSAIPGHDGGALIGMRCALAEEDNGIVGIAFVRFVQDAPAPFAVLEDLLVDDRRRGTGLGRRFLNWLGDQGRAQGYGRLFLESGVDNAAAHRFFEDHGFSQTSIVMMRNLSAS